MILKILIGCLLMLPAAASAQVDPADRYTLTLTHAAYDAAPADEDRAIPADEDQAVLNEALGRIFPDGFQNLSAELRSVEIMRYTTGSLLLKNNGGSATKIIREGYAICGGMSHVFRVLCRKAGVPSRYVGAFYLRPLMGSHAISEVYYGGKWHLFDATFGIFFYSREDYDGKGEVLSLHDLLTDPAAGTAMKVVPKPWVGTYDAAVRAFDVGPVEPGYLKENYGTPIMELYRKYLRETYPVVHREGDLISFPVDADLRTQKDLWIGGVDGKDRDVVEQAMNGSSYLGSHYLGGGMAPAFHTWSIGAPGGALLTLDYHSVEANPPPLRFVCLKAARLISSHREARQASFTFRVIGTEAIVAVTCPTRSFSVDAMHLFLAE